LVNEITENPTPIQRLPKRAWDHSGKRFGSIEKAKRDLGFEAKTKFEDGLKSTIRWTKENRRFIERCMNKHRDFLK
jgi:UDP-glucose 4-epimerase